MIGIIDYNAGNIRSVEHALSSLNIEYVLSKNPSDLKDCDKVIFPGVGDAKYAMDQLKITGFDSFLKDFAISKKPILGICLGSQIIFDYSDEGDTKTLGLIPGKVVHMQKLLNGLATENLENNNNDIIKIPHMGWNDISYTKKCVLFEGIPEHKDFYFVHSYVIQPDDFSVISATTNYGKLVIPAAVQKDNIYAMQFHPEKSGIFGLRILQNFCTKEGL